jgi:hypothetical protein
VGPASFRRMIGVYAAWVAAVVFVVSVTLSSALLARMSISAAVTDDSICRNSTDRTATGGHKDTRDRQGDDCQICAASFSVVLTPEAPDVFRPISPSSQAEIGAVQLSIRAFLPSDQHARGPPARN